MKRSKIAALTAGLCLMIAGAYADAVCRPNTCYQKFNQCRASGTPFATCYAAYEDCLIRNGCQIP